MAETPDGVYRAAAQAYMTALPFPPDPQGRDTVDRLVRSRGFRAAVDAVWRARDGEIKQLWAERDSFARSAADYCTRAVAAQAEQDEALVELAKLREFGYDAGRTDHQLVATVVAARADRDKALAILDRVRTCLDEDIAWQRQAYGDGTDKVGTGRLIGMEDARRSVLAALGGANTNGRPPSTGPDGAHT